MSTVRYREGSQPSGDVSTVTDDVLVISVVYALIVGVGLCIAAYRYRQIWLVVWGGGLAVVSAIYLGGKALRFF